jgi:hypothetical protein
MATEPRTPQTAPPPPPPRDVPPGNVEPGYSRSPLAARDSMRETYRQKLEREDEAAKVADEVAFLKTQGIQNDDMRDRILAMGGDATRSSPDWFQALEDAEPGLTTTTGVARTPMDPTTAAVPAPERSPLVRDMRGTPTLGSGRKSGQAEELWLEPQRGPSRGE